jgi:WD40 repeat protein
VNPVDGRVATAYSDGIITLWNKDMWRPQTFRVGPHRGKVHDLVFTPDGRHLITANGNGTLYVLRLKAWPPATPQGGTTENR